MAASELDHLLEVEKYYQDTQGSYQRWGADPDRPEIYSLHFGWDNSDLRDEANDNKAALVVLTDKLIDFAQMRDGMKVLDSGCGTGTVSYRIHDRFPQCRVYGINISTIQLQEAIKYNQRNGQPPYFIKSDYHSQSFDKGVFDLIIFCESFIHSPLKKGLLQESARVLRKGGSLVVADYFQMQEPASVKVRKRWKELKSGWKLPYFMAISDFVPQMEKAGFEEIVNENLTERVKNSVTLLGEGCKAKLEKDEPVPIAVSGNRLASVAFMDLMLSGDLGYYFVKGRQGKRIEKVF